MLSDFATLATVRSSRSASVIGDPKSSTFAMSSIIFPSVTEAACTLKSLVTKENRQTPFEIMEPSTQLYESMTKGAAMAVEVEAGLSKVEVGDAVRTGYRGEVRDYITAESCGQNGGHWHCVTHDKAFVNNLAKDEHLHHDGAAHTLAWFCHEHGIETP